MSLEKLLAPREQLLLQGAAPESGIIDRIATHQRIAVPHWVETREGCLVGRYSSLMPVKEAVSEIERFEAAGKSSTAGAEEFAALRQMARDRPTFWPQFASVDEKVAAEFEAADWEEVVLVPVGRTVLTDFLGLHARRTTSIDAFVRRFGTLHTYTEGFVSQNGLAQTAMWRKHYGALAKHIRDEDNDNGVDAFEPVAYWQAFSRFAFLTLMIATQLDPVPTGDKTPVSAEDWYFFRHFLDVRTRRRPEFDKLARRRPVVSPDVSGTSFLLTDSAGNLRTRFCEVLNKLQEIGDVKLELRWEKSPPTLEFRVTGLVSVIAAQLLMAASQRENFALCRECQEAFRPWQQPLTGNTDLYCEECRSANAPQRNAMRRYRATQKYRDTLQRAKTEKSAAMRPETSPPPT